MVKRSQVSLFKEINYECCDPAMSEPSGWEIRSPSAHTVVDTSAHLQRVQTPVMNTSQGAFNAGFSQDISRCQNIIGQHALTIQRQIDEIARLQRVLRDKDEEILICQRRVANLQKQVELANKASTRAISSGSLDTSQPSGSSLEYIDGLQEQCMVAVKALGDAAKDIHSQRGIPAISNTQGILEPYLTH